MPKPEQKTARNRAIVTAYLDGVPVAKLAKDHGISASYVYDIIRWYKLRAIRMKGAISAYRLRTSRDCGKLSEGGRQ